MHENEAIRANRGPQGVHFKDVDVGAYANAGERVVVPAGRHEVQGKKTECYELNRDVRNSMKPTEKLIVLGKNVSHIIL